MVLNISQFMFNKISTSNEKDLPIIRFKPRPYQKKAIEEFDSRVDNWIAYICWARRLGKDQCVFAYSVDYCVKHPNSRVYYLFPQIKQGVKAIFEGVTTDGVRWIESIVDPRVLKRAKSGALYFYDNTIRFKNGSIISLVGDDGDALVGGNLDILVISEAALVRQSTLEYLIPSVLKNKGKILCVSTPRYGSFFNKSILDPDNTGYKSVIRADEAYDEEGNRIYTNDELAQARAIMSKARYNSEYNVDLAAYNALSIYGPSLESAKMIDMPDIRDCRIFISADLGTSDNSSYTFGVFIDGKLKIIDSYRNRNVPTQHYIDYVNKWIAERNIPRRMVSLILPQDSKNVIDANRYLTSRVEFWRSAGFDVKTLTHIGVLRGIELTRAAIENHDLEFVNNYNVKNLISIVKAYEWKKTPQGEVLYVPNHGTGFAASNDADSLEYMNIAFFLDKYERSIKTDSGVIIN